MSNVTIERSHMREDALLSTSEFIQDVLKEIRRKAFSLFEQRGRLHGSDVDDWLRAEREVVWTPDLGILETDQDFQIQMFGAGLDAREAREIRIIAVPDAIIVQADARRSPGDGRHARSVADRSGKRIFRRLTLPCQIDVDKVTATFKATAKLKRGTLCITAPKAEQPKRELDSGAEARSYVLAA